MIAVSSSVVTCEGHDLKAALHERQKVVNQRWKSLHMGLLDMPRGVEDKLSNPRPPLRYVDCLGQDGALAVVGINLVRRVETKPGRAVQVGAGWRER